MYKRASLPSYLTVVPNVIDPNLLYYSYSSASCGSLALNIIPPAPLLSKQLFLFAFSSKPESGKKGGIQARRRITTSRNMPVIVDGVPVLVPPPEGYTVDFDHPRRNLVPEIYYISGAGLLLSSVFVAQRVYTKVFVSKKVQAEDYLLLSAWVLSITITAILLRAIVLGIGLVHVWEMPLRKYGDYRLYAYVAWTFFNLPGSLAKLSILSFYLRLSPQTSFIWAVRAALACIVVYTVGLLFGTLFACTPMHKAWDVNVTGGHCVNPAGRFIATAVLNLVSDLVILCLPLPIVYKLQVSKAQKFGLLVVFTLASATIVTTTVRLVYIIPLLRTSDPTWEIGPVSIWGIVEANLLVICASLPTVPLFVRNVAPRALRERLARPEAPRNTPRRDSFVTIGGRRLTSKLPGGRADRYSIIDPDYELYGNAGWVMADVQPRAHEDDYGAGWSESLMPGARNDLQAKTASTSSI
ncbi:hypothetical protein F4775DRAFT_562414 [Biscogniauxia sp. FL1348]|nr:hypothetical protein F4775DRAFT_562414 [Biscogniauxia sp. FL1348]